MSWITDEMYDLGYQHGQRAALQTKHGVQMKDYSKGCGKTIGHGETCVSDYLCGACVESLDLCKQITQLRKEKEELIGMLERPWLYPADVAKRLKAMKQKKE